MLSFNPGPSQLSIEVKADIIDLANGDLLSTSHRSAEFQGVTERCVGSLRRVFSIPDDFHILFHHSATGAMESILRNCVDVKSGHIVNGAFSDRMYQTALELGLETEKADFAWGEAIDVDSLNFTDSVEIINFTHNETSTGLMWPNSALQALRKKYNDTLICFDMTSSFGAAQIDYQLCDIIFASVQKCLGLPAGLGVMIFNNKALAKAKNKQIPAWQNFNAMLEKMASFQTVETPNVFAIALLERQLARMNFVQILKDTSAKYNFIMEQNLWQAFIKDEAWCSRTVLNLELENPSDLIKKLNAHNIVMGSGYGKLKQSCIRIANFPAITLADVKQLVHILKS
jgi:phosphoserine aminotransferase